MSIEGYQVLECFLWYVCTRVCVRGFYVSVALLRLSPAFVVTRAFICLGLAGVPFHAHYFVPYHAIPVASCPPNHV